MFLVCLEGVVFVFVLQQLHNMCMILCSCRSSYDLFEERLADFTDFFRHLKSYSSLRGFDDQERLWHLQRPPVARMHVSKKWEGGHIGAANVPRAVFSSCFFFGKISEIQLSS